MAYGLDQAWVMAPPDVRTAGIDEWTAMSGISPAHPLVGGPGWGVDSSGFQPDSGLSRIVGDAVNPAMPGGAPADPRLRARWNDWRELFNPHSPMLWLLLLAAAAASLIHLRLEGRVLSARAGGELGR
jgi:hypothetical protein